MTSQEFSSAESPREYAEAVLLRSQTSLRAAVEALRPEQPDADPLTVFDPPTPKRDEAPDPGYTPQQEAAVRTAAAELGFGRLEDRTLSEQGIFGADVVLEGGQPHKMAAEAALVLADTVAQPASLIFSASPNRAINDPTEQASALQQTGVVGATEYDVARDIALSLPGLVAEEAPVVLPVSYDIQNGFALGQEATGQLMRIGHIDGMPVLLLRVDREDYVDENGKNKYRKQPKAADLLKMVGDMRADDKTVPTALVTSSTYEASRNVSAATLGLSTDRVVAVASYGTQRLANTKDKITDEEDQKVPTPAAINQLPGEMHKMAKEIILLEAALDNA